MWQDKITTWLARLFINWAERLNYRFYRRHFGEAFVARMKEENARTLAQIEANAHRMSKLRQSQLLKSKN